MARLEELIAWQRATALADSVYRATAIGEFDQDRRLRDQMRSAAVSVASNIAEGHGRGGRKEFARFLQISVGSCAELRTQVYIAGRSGTLPPAWSGALLADCAEVSGLVSRLRAAVRRQKD